MYIHCNVAQGLHSYMFCKCLQYMRFVMSQDYGFWNRTISDSAAFSYTTSFDVLLCRL